MIKNIFSRLLKGAIKTLVKLDSSINDKSNQMPNGIKNIALFKEESIVQPSIVLADNNSKRVETQDNISAYPQQQQLSLKQMIAESKDTKRYFTVGNSSYIFK